MNTGNTAAAQGQMVPLHESRLRSLLKAISYRIIGTITTAGIALLVTGDVASAIAIGVVEPAAKIVIYYVHERVWQHVPLGTVRKLIKRVRRRLGLNKAG